MAKKYYIAYSSNLNVQQMGMRCPSATVFGTAIIKGWELLFKGSKTGFYLTIERCESGSGPVAIWEVDDVDEKALDRYEGFPFFYYKKDIEVCCRNVQTGKNQTLTAFAYIMHEERRIGIPSARYMSTCLEGYDVFGFDRKVLLDAYDKCTELCTHKE